MIGFTRLHTLFMAILVALIVLAKSGDEEGTSPVVRASRMPLGRESEQLNHNDLTSKNVDQAKQAAKQNERLGSRSPAGGAPIVPGGLPRVSSSTQSPTMAGSRSTPTTSAGAAGSRSASL